MKFNPKNPVNFKYTFTTFIATLFRTKKCKIYRSFLIKGYEILAVKFIKELVNLILLIDLIKQLFNLFKRKGLFRALF